MIDAEQEKHMDILAETEATTSRRPWHKPPVTHLQIKKTTGGSGSHGDGQDFTPNAG